MHDHRPGVLSGRREWLLAQNMKAASERIARNTRVLTRRRRHVDELDAPALGVEELPMALVDSRVGERCVGFVTPCSARVGDRDDLELARACKSIGRHMASLGE